MILDWYKYLFYRVYKWRSSRPKTIISRPELDAVTFIAISNIFYLMGLSAIFAAFSGSFGFSMFAEKIGETKIISGIIAIALFLLHVYAYIWSGNSKKIIAEYEKSNYKPTKLGTFGVIFYMVFSYLLFVGVGILLTPSIRTHLPNLF